MRKTAADFDWDAVIENMVYVWTGLTQAIGLNYYGIPGIDVPPDIGFQYREPGEDEAFMREDEYDALIADPTGFLFNNWLSRVSTEVVAPGSPILFATIFLFSNAAWRCGIISARLDNELNCSAPRAEVARDGGYIMDASAIMQDNASVENVKVITEFTREYGIY